MRELGAIEQRIKDDATAALKAGDKRRREALSSFVAALKKERIDSRKEPERGRRARGTQARAQAARGGHRAVRARRPRRSWPTRNASRTTCWPRTCPRSSTTRLEQLVDEAITASGASSPKEMGKVMKELMPRVAGRADGKKLSDLVRGKLGG